MLFFVQRKLLALQYFVVISGPGACTVQHMDDQLESGGTGGVSVGAQKKPNQISLGILLFLLNRVGFKWWYTHRIKGPSTS